MADLNALNPHPPEYERFLYAPVGEDRNGSAVTVLSALARLGLDPWTETAELATLGRDAARTRLGILLSRLRDVPALDLDQGKLARELSLLLPDRAPAQAGTRAIPALAGGRLTSNGAIWAMIAILFVVVQILFGGNSGVGQ